MPELDPYSELIRVIGGLKNIIQVQDFCGLKGYRPVNANKDSAIKKQVAEIKKDNTNISTMPKVTLDDFREKINTCQKCSLGATRTNFVFGVGNSEAKLVFVGEAPGKDEDLQGVPFVGQAGQLLTKIIESINLKREDVYICNVLKCRPPDNRNPLPEEIELCEPYLIKQLEIIQPQVICALGTFAAQTLLKTKERIMNLRGNLYSYQGIPLIPTLHPAACLYHRENKKYVWEDIQKVQQLYLEKIK